MPIRERKCWHCGRLFSGNAKARYCGATCRKRAERERKK